jgi:hypothetical protein
MADDNVVAHGNVYPDEVSAMVDNHPYIPAELKRVYINTNKPKDEPEPDSNIEDRREQTVPNFIAHLAGESLAPSSIADLIQSPLNPQLAAAASQPVINQDQFTQAHKDLGLNQQEQDLYQRHLTNLYGAGGVDHPDGSRSTLYQSVQQHDGKFYNIPTVWDGKVETEKYTNPEGKVFDVANQTALNNVAKVGWDKFPSYDTADEADKRYEAMHQYMEKDTARYNMGKDLGSGSIPEAPRSLTDKLLGRRGERYQFWPERAVRSIMGDIAAIGNTAQGKAEMFVTDPDTGKQGVNPEVMNAIGGLASTAIGAPAPWASKLADGTLGSFAGVRSKKVDRRALGDAQIFEADGMHPDKILAQTGFARGADGRWRHEIDDSKAVFNENWPQEAMQAKIEHKNQRDKEFLENPFKQQPFTLEDFAGGNVTKTLPEVLDHPKLYEHYPFLKAIPVILDETIPTAHWSPSEGVIRTSSAYNNKGTMIHEIQHAIQDYEGFAKGAFPGKAGEHYQLRLAEEGRKQILDPLKKLWEESQERHFTAPEMKRISELLTMADKWTKYVQAGDEEAYQSYMKSAGEVEARNSEARMLLSKQDRRTLPPEGSEDTPRSQQIVSPDVRVGTPYGLHDPDTGSYLRSGGSGVQLYGPGSGSEKDLDRLEEIAANLHKDKRPRGPR